MDSVIHEANRTYKTKKREHVKYKINELETNSKNKNIRDIHTAKNYFKKGYQPRTNLVKMKMICLQIPTIF
jgi:hypothetical protein